MLQKGLLFSPLLITSLHKKYSSIPCACECSISGLYEVAKLTLRVINHSQPIHLKLESKYAVLQKWPLLSLPAYPKRSMQHIVAWSVSVRVPQCVDQFIITVVNIISICRTISVFSPPQVRTFGFPNQHRTITKKIPPSDIFKTAVFSIDIYLQRRKVTYLMHVCLCSYLHFYQLNY